MRNFYIKPGMILRLGREGENLARRLIYDFSRWRDTFGDGIVQLIVQRPGEDTPYPVALKIEGETAVWEVTNADTAIPGSGKAEFQYFVGDALEKSETFATNILDALGAAGAEAPEPAQDWVNKVLSAANRVESAAIHQPTIIDSTWWVWNPDTGVYEDTGEAASAFTVTVTADPDAGFVADKTSAEIYAAYTAGMSVHAIVPEQNLSLPLVRCSEGVAEFYAVTGGNAQFNVLTIYGSEVGMMGGAVNPETPDEEYVQLLIETDMLPAVYNADGKILTDSNGNVVLRY